ncbi:MAG TPA: cyclic nucleotide-binding domain-containing protein, partial [Candidatus Sulfotelmatobacter sp.]|nr:cyclic nucleotide-binding domain-containing protein [Candidatus Sulfotelmatobacter sp.]
VRRVRGERTAVLLRLSPGDVGGFLTFFTDEPSPVSVRSAEASLVFEIGRREFQGLLEEWPALAAKMLFALLSATVTHLKGVLEGQVTVAAWTLEVAHQLRQLPLIGDV